MDSSLWLMLWTFLILGGWIAAVIGFRKGNRTVALVAILLPPLGYVAAFMPTRHHSATSSS